MVCALLFTKQINVLNQPVPAGTVVTTPSMICLIIAGVAVVAYFIESGVSPTRQYIWDITNPLGVQHHIHHVRSNSPRLCFHVECYHYHTVTRTVTDSNGKTTSSTHQEKRVTHTESQPFGYDCWDDISGDLIGVGAMYRLTRIRFHKTYVFADEYTRYTWEAEARSIQDRNRFRDTHMDFWHCMDISGHTPRMLAINGNPEDVPKCLGKGFYVLWSFLLCGYCYRSWFHSISTRQTYEFVKRIKRHQH